MQDSGRQPMTSTWHYPDVFRRNLWYKTGTPCTTHRFQKAFWVQFNFSRFLQSWAGLNNEFWVVHDVGNPQKYNLIQPIPNKGSSLDTANLFIIKIEKCILLKLDYKLSHWNQCVQLQVENWKRSKCFQIFQLFWKHS